ncbi:Cystathionine beta-lyase family protein involved in aluminum resistance [Seinonella peptonophila]|uniref:Cystathionine beta-lyase family protein involved in aluminum resistance n=1 Tax=Seinonella peptonophila TaxID=112248 RepID=A0A1M4T1S2_9BACL|nr:methionine gamma-lyase family protein [Seinonella peptonophila]SHE38350.1 Cystathionine beta-lyase family protein involved in aluminum resistance [Seinonella peptonophila]
MSNWMTDWDYPQWAAAIEQKIAAKLRWIDQRTDIWQACVLEAFRSHRVSEYHFYGTVGYGYHDVGRETLEAVFADVFSSEAALVRPQIVSGTHAISLALFSILRPGDELLYLSGQPYDTLLPIIGKGRDGTGSLADYGIRYREVPLTSSLKLDKERLKEMLTEKTKVIAIQRSRGYSSRPSFTISEIADAIRYIRSLASDVLIFVDNCYGEFVELEEPTHVGADLIAGSLIKNPGGGLAKTGGYLAGKKEWILRAADRLIAPQLGLEMGATGDGLRDFFQGLFLAPHTVGEALKGIVFAAAALEMEGFETSPSWDENRTDIVQQVILQKPEWLIAFCQGIQSASPVDSYLKLEPTQMPGYDDPVVMAAGTFVSGASIELSADGPMRSPYIAYLQGGLTYSHVKIAICSAIQQLKAVMKNSCVNISNTY